MGKCPSVCFLMSLYELTAIARPIGVVKIFKIQPFLGLNTYARSFFEKTINITPKNLLKISTLISHGWVYVLRTLINWKWWRVVGGGLTCQNLSSTWTLLCYRYTKNCKIFFIIKLFRGWDWTAFDGIRSPFLSNDLKCQPIYNPKVAS